MSLVINGKTYRIVCLNGKEYSRGYFNGRLVLNVPDNNAYLWAGPGVRLAAADNAAVSYLSTPQIVQDALSQQKIGLGNFKLSFEVHKDAVETGTVYLLTLSGVLAVKSEGGKLAFKFLWEDSPAWRFAPQTVLAEGWNAVVLQKQNAQVTLCVNNAVYMLIDHSNGTPVKNKIYRGFGTSRSIHNDFFGLAPYVYIFNIIPAQVNYAQQTIFSHAANSATKLYMNTSGRLVYQENITSGTYSYAQVDSIPALVEGQRYWLKLMPHLVMAEDDNTVSLDDVINGTDGLEWKTVCGPNGNGNYASWGKCPQFWGVDKYNNSSSYIWRGGIDMAKMAVIKNEEVVFDGRKDSYFVENASDSGWSVETWQDKPDLPDLSAGELSVTQGWMKVKDVKAILL